MNYVMRIVRGVTVGLVITCVAYAISASLVSGMYGSPETIFFSAVGAPLVQQNVFASVFPLTVFALGIAYAMWYLFMRGIYCGTYSKKFKNKKR